MNRKQRRMAQAQSQAQPTIQLHDRMYTIDEVSALAIQAHGLKKFQVAVDLYDLVLAKAPHAESYNNQGVILHDMGKNEEALAAFNKALALKPDLAAAYNNKGNALQKMKRYEETITSYTKAIKLKPDYAEAHNNLGMTLQEMKRFDEALASYANALAIKPDMVEAYNNRGNILQDQKRYEEALVNYEKAIGLKPDLAAAYNNKGNVLYKMKRPDEALANYDKAIALKPDYADAYAYNNRGNILQQMKRYDEALACYGKAITLDPKMAEVYNNWASTLFEMKRHEEALPYYDKAVAFKPDYAEAWQNRGNLLRVMGRMNEALESFARAVELDPDIPYLIGDLLHSKMNLCNWQGVDALFGRLMEGLEAGKPVTYPFPLITTTASAMQHRKCAEICIMHKQPPTDASIWKGKIYAHDKIRIGYLSADYYSHATAHLMVKLFEIHDRSKFEIIGISFGSPSADDMNIRLQKSFDRFIDVSNQSDEGIAQTMKDMEIDIAVDLKGYTKDSRTGIFVFRPAPVQVNYLGYPGTMAVSYIDYLIADQVIIPEDHKPYYSEKIVYLPDSYQVNDSSRPIAEKNYTRKEMDLPENGFIFCCFNNNYKITPGLFDIWMRLLHKVPGSVLWLLKGPAISVDNLRAEAEGRGIDGNRLIFAPHMRTDEHLARQRLADVFLDTFNCNAHTTASDALWGGLPVLTYLGDTFASRVATSLLTAVGLPELITHSHAEYEALALELATNPERMAAIKAKLAQNRTTTPLYNTALYAKRLEAAYSKMWERAKGGQAPDHIYIAPETGVS